MGFVLEHNICPYSKRLGFVWGVGRLVWIVCFGVFQFQMLIEASGRNSSAGKLPTLKINYHAFKLV